jgi:hypothetical protein
MPRLPTWLPSNYKKAVNAAWIANSLARQKTLYDLGINPAQRRSTYYAMERLMTFWYRPRVDLPGWMP